MMGNDHFLYIVTPLADDGHTQSTCKIGTTNSPRERLSSLQGGSPYRLALFHIFRLPSKEMARSIEQGVLACHDSIRLNGEWLAIDPIRAVHIAGLHIMAALTATAIDPTERYQIAELCGAANGDRPLAPNFGVLP